MTCAASSLFHIDLSSHQQSGWQLKIGFKGCQRFKAIHRFPFSSNLPDLSLSLTVLFLDLFADIFANKTDRRFFDAVFEFSSWSTSSEKTHKIVLPSDWLKLTKISVICGACTIRQKWFPFSVARTWNYKRIEFTIVFIHSKIKYGF